ncbi:MAG: hypothetical protein IPK60_22240 [Sandaracinaceae bacterium]|nr:hypothetical protein [Sandaracinaceae bacterium]
MRLRFTFLFSVLALSACNAGTLSGATHDALDAGSSDAGAPVDAAAGIDAGNRMDMSFDAALTPSDLGSDLGNASTDAGVGMDAAHSVDSGAGLDAGVDASASVDAGAYADAGTSPGCGMTHAVGRSTITLTVMGESRSFLLSITDAYDSAHPAPLLMGFHGCGDSPMGAWYSLNLVTDGSGVEAAFGGRAVYVYPAGLPTSGCATGWTLSNLDKDLAFMDAIRAYMAANYCIDARGVMIIGLSYGGEFVNRYACRRASEIIFSSPLAAGDPVPSGCTGPVPQWISWGTADTGISEGSFNNIRSTWITNNACSSSMSDPVPESPMCLQYRDCEVDPVIACRVVGGAHAQPSPNYGPALFSFYRRLIGEIPWP